MMTTGFGRRLNEPRYPDLVLVSNTPAEAVASHANLARSVS